MKKLLTSAFALTFTAVAAQAQVLYTEDFSTGFVDQAAQVALDGDASVSFGANTAIGDTNATGDGTPAASAGTASGLGTRNGTRGYFATADANFTSATAGVGQLHTHTAGGFGVLSVGPITTIGGVANSPTPITSTFNEGDVFRVTFDMYVQANTTDTSGAINWNIKAADFTVITDAGDAVSDYSWNEFQTATIGDVVAVSKELTITASMIADGIASIGPQFTFHNNSGNLAFNTAYAQIDNFQLERIAVPEPGTYALLAGLAALSFVTARRRK